MGELLIRSVTQLKYELYYIGTFRIQEMANGEFLDQVRASGEGCTVGGLLIRSVTQGHRTLGGTQELVRLPRGFLGWLEGEVRVAPFQNSFSSLSARWSCFLHDWVPTVYVININPRSIQSRKIACKYDIMGLLCYLPSLNDIHTNLDRCQN